jgi:Flp pilus assembly protein TadG
MIPSVKKFARNERGNVAIRFGFMAVPIIFVTGMTIDYSVSQRVQTKLNAAADAAALAAVTPTMMAQSDSAAIAAAQNMFSALMTDMPSLVYDPTQVVVTAAHPNGNSSTRNITVSYREQSKNIFAGVLGASTLTVKGTSTASASIAPNIDFYLLLDASGSMLLPATTAGINTMTSLTTAQTTGGCAFACHEGNPNAGDITSNPSNGSGGHIDNYKLARNNSITLRTDEVPTAVTALMSTAAYDQANIGGIAPVYRMSVNIFDDVTPPPIMSLTVNYASSWASNSSKYVIKQMWTNNVDCNSQASCTGSGSGTGDAKTNFDTAFTTLNTLMPNPGNGTNVSGDTPQEILFLVSDGMEDEMYGGNRYYQPINNPARTGTNLCDTIKNRGIKIAVLYTTYLPLQDPWSVSNVMPFLPQVAPAMQACATSGLYFQVSPGEDIGSALSALFQLAVQSSHLTN